MRRLQRGKHRLLAHTEGASAVEFAIILPVLALLICGLIDFGNLYYQMHTVNEAARAGARYGSVDSTLANIPTDVTQYIQNNYSNKLQVTILPSPLVSQGKITVTVSNSVKIFTPLISAFFSSNPYTIKGSCVMELEN